jgi:hypothetical protein
MKEPKHYTWATKVSAFRKTESSSKATDAEIEQIIHELKSFVPVLSCDISKGADMLSPHMFVVEK